MRLENPNILAPQEESFLLGAPFPD